MDIMDKRKFHKLESEKKEYKIKTTTNLDDQNYDYIFVPAQAHQVILAIKELAHLSGKFVIQSLL